jgi:hypothetical protein
MTGPLLVRNYHASPLVRATPALHDPRSLRSLAEELGYLFFEGFMPQQLLDPVRDFVRTFAAKAGWAQAEAEKSGSLSGMPGARLSGRG